MTGSALALGAVTAVVGSLFLAAGDAKIRPAPPPPPYTGAYQPQGVDEIGLWRRADEDERRLANSPLVIRDEKLNDYVRGVLCKTIGDDRCNSVRIYIVRIPAFNASMTPNGTMQVFSGLLLRTRNEAELAAVLGHEFGHFEKRHTLKQFKAARSGTDLLSWAALLSSMSNTQNARTTFQDVQISVLGGLAKFGRDQEQEADLLGLGYLNASDLRPSAASRVWRNLIREREASALERGLRKPDFDRTAFFASHPASGERAEYLYSLATPNDENKDDGADRYAAAMASWLPQFLDDQIKINDFGGSDFIINQLAETGWNAMLWSARGDLYRARGNPRDLMNAVDFYGKAVALDPILANAQRGLGLSLLKTGRKAEGVAALRQYLELKPDAHDASMIAMLVEKGAN